MIKLNLMFCSDDTRKKISESMKGKTLNEESKKKMSEARKAYWAKRRES